MVSNCFTHTNMILIQSGTSYEEVVNILNVSIINKSIFPEFWDTENFQIRIVGPLFTYISLICQQNVIYFSKHLVFILGYIP